MHKQSDTRYHAISLIFASMKHIAALLLLCLPVLLFAQQKPSLPYVAPDAPDWMKMIAELNPNVYEVQKAYATYYDKHPFAKNAYTQYFKHWMHWARPFVQPDGFVHEPNMAEMEAQETTLLALRNASAKRGGQTGWRFVGHALLEA